MSAGSGLHPVRLVAVGGGRSEEQVDLVDTGAQMFALKQLIEDAEGTWLGASVLIDNLQNHSARRELTLRAVFHLRDL